MPAGSDGQMMSVKYGHRGEITVIFRYVSRDEKVPMQAPIVKSQWPMVYDLTNDPGEQWNLMNEKADMFWMFGPALKVLGEYEASVAKYPSVKPGEEFTGYGGAAKDGSSNGAANGAHSGQLKAAEYEHHHAPG
jgi:hypothetical protein